MVHRKGSPDDMSAEDILAFLISFIGLFLYLWMSQPDPLFPDPTTGLLIFAATGVGGLFLWPFVLILITIISAVIGAPAE